MNRVTLIDPATASGPRKELLDQINGAFGRYAEHVSRSRQLAGCFEKHVGLIRGPGFGAPRRKARRTDRRAIADRNACNYCLAAHTALGRKAGATAEEMTAAQSGRYDDPRTAAVLVFALKVVETCAQVAADDIASLRKAGFDDEQIVEILAHVALNLFTNYVNVAFDGPVDFPAVKLTRTAA